MKDKDLLRYSRHIMLPEIDIEGQRKISSAKVAIIGLGGLGCSASIFLTSSGVGELCLVDDDVIDLSNLQRQILFSESDVDKGKILVAKESLSSLNKDIKNISAIIFDKDGTLTNSHIYWAEIISLRSNAIIDEFKLNPKYFSLIASSMGLNTDSNNLEENGPIEKPR